jgi:hypothetical protein
MLSVWSLLKTGMQSVERNRKIIEEEKNPSLSFLDCPHLKI